MRRALFTSLSLVVLILTAATAGAVDKVPRPAPVPDTTDRLTPVPPTAPTDQSEAGVTKPADKYDTFIDQNGNGVDDRQENLITKDKPTEQPTQTPGQKTDPAPDSTDKK